MPFVDVQAIEKAMTIMIIPNAIKVRAARSQGLVFGSIRNVPEVWTWKHPV